jgi:hypothetical protein
MSIGAGMASLADTYWLSKREYGHLTSFALMAQPIGLLLDGPVGIDTSSFVILSCG